MSKKKNTLKDLDEFLKQQAATLVTPASLSEKLTEVAKPSAPQVEEKADRQPAGERSTKSLQQIMDDIQQFAAANGKAFKPQLFDILIKTFEAQTSFSAEDTMLVNTLLYLKHGENWKTAIRDFWKNKANQGR